MIEMEAQSKTYELVGRTAGRSSCRLKARFRVLYSVPSMDIYHNQEVYEIGWLRNRSNGGVLLETSHHIAQGDRLELNFNSPDNISTYRAEAVVRWARKRDDHTFHIGLQFESFDQLYPICTPDAPPPPVSSHPAVSAPSNLR